MAQNIKIYIETLKYRTLEHKSLEHRTLEHGTLDQSIENIEE